MTGDDRKSTGWDGPEPPVRARDGRAGRLPRPGLRHLMLVVVYFASVFWAARNAVQTGGTAHLILLGVLIGLGITALGLLVALRSGRFSVLGWIAFVVGIAALQVATMGYIAVASLPVVVGAIVYLGLRRRSTNQDALLWVLNAAADRGMPLAPGVAAFSGQVTGVFRIWAGSLAELLRRGSSLPEAVESVPKVVPAGSAILIRMGWESGNLASGLGEATRARARQLPTLRIVGTRVAYFCWLVIVAESVVGYVSYRVTPRLEAIFQDFGVGLPEVTARVFHAARYLEEYGFFFVLPQLAFFLYLLIAFLGSGSLGVPGFDRLFRRHHSILILRALAVAVESGRPIGPALETLAGSYPRGWVRRRLAHSSLDARNGVDWVDALHASGLISAGDAGVMVSAQRAGNLPWALRELAESGERRRGYRLQALTQISFAIAVLAMGGLIFVISVAYFVPLTRLISRLAE